MICNRYRKKEYFYVSIVIFLGREIKKENSSQVNTSKYQGMNLTKQIKYCCNKNYKNLKERSKQMHIKNAKALLVNALEK